MKKFIYFFSFFITLNMAFAQALQLAEYSPVTSGDKPLAPWYENQGVRGIWVADDMDKDGLQEVLATDYSNGGRVHVMEMIYSREIGVVFSTPVIERLNRWAIPRWVRSGDLDGDGNLEFIFSLSGETEDSVVQVWEWNGHDNSYGINGKPTFELEADKFMIPNEIGNFRTNREQAEVYDWDGDGRDELIMANRDHGVYILGVDNSFPGDAEWKIEGGAPGQVDENIWSGGSWWHSIPADIDGDGTKEIVNYYWNYYGFWAIEPTGPDSYEYPAATNENAYREYAQTDAVSYMGVWATDVDGNGKDEIVGAGYGADHKIGLLSLPRNVDVLNGFTEADRFNWIADGFWTLAGKTEGEHWGIGTADLDMDGRDEILVGGRGGYNLTRMKYMGQSEDDGGDVLDPENYESSIIFKGPEEQYARYDIYDSAGVAIDTVKYETPFVSRIFAGSDINNDGYPEIILAYQSVVDSVRYDYYQWSDDDDDYLYYSEKLVPFDHPVNIRVLEWGRANLPVELTLFNAKLNNNKVNLTWQTATEKNNQGFEIERSVDKKNWRIIGFVDGNGTTTENRSYTFIDDTPAKTISYYRLKQIDYDGSYEYSQTIELNTNVPTRFSLSQNYPNPFNPSTKITFSLPEKANVVLSVYNPVGELVRRLTEKEYEAGKYEIDFNASGLTSGVYFYRIDVTGDKGNYTDSKKLVLIK